MRGGGAARFQILAAALLFSTGGAAIKAVSMSAWQIACVRSAVAAIALALIMPSWRRGWSVRTLAVGLAYASTMVLFVLGNKLTTNANVIFLQATAPMYLLFLGPLLLREKIGRREILVAAAMALGMAMFFVGIQDPQTTAPSPRLGNILGALGGLSWALTLAGLRWLGRGNPVPGADPAGGAVVAGNAMAGLLCAPLALPWGAPSSMDWSLVVCLGLFQIGLAYVFMTRGVRGVGVFEASLLLVLEPVAGVFWTWVFHGERPAGWSLVGCAVVLIATMTNTLVARRGALPEIGTAA